MRYADAIKRILNASERQIFLRLNSPQRLQDFLDKIPINFEHKGETNHSPIIVIKRRLAHCFEGAVFAAAVLAFHGHKPLVMDFATAYDDEDHTIALFRHERYWGAFSKTNHAVLRYRDPIYKTPRELAMSYFHEYYLWDGRKSLRAYSRPFDLSKYPPERWIATTDSLNWLMKKISASRYISILPTHPPKLRRASVVERKALKITEWKKNSHKSSCASAESERHK